MNIDFLSASSFDAQSAPGIVTILVAKDDDLARAAAPFGEALAQAASRAAAMAPYAGKAGQKIDLLAPSGAAADRLVFLSVGDTAELTSQSQLELGGSLTAAFEKAGPDTVTIIDATGSVDALLLAEGAQLRAYRFDKYRTKEGADKKPTLLSLQIVTDASTAPAYGVRKAVVDGVHLTRDLCSEPPNVLTPMAFANRARELESLGLEVSIIEEAELIERGFNTLVGVGQGSEQPSALAIMHWRGASDDSAPVAFVGKGVTFDTGGISIKPALNMEDMKWDMGGAGIVTGTMAALAGRKAKVNAVGVIGLVENMPGGNAQRPGDIVTSLSGQTVEILNTDAEGRLVLADALWYTKETYEPDVMIDLATLTGAIIVSLGDEYAGMFTNDDSLASQLDAAGSATGDKLWRFPLHKNYDKMIDTPSADMKNIGSGGAGSITAAQFLQRFVGDTKWAHLDVAGVVWSKKDKPLSEKGATGYGVRLLDRFVADNYEV